MEKKENRFKVNFKNKKVNKIKVNLKYIQHWRNVGMEENHAGNT